jgi:hypothetical protein
MPTPGKELPLKKGSGSGGRESGRRAAFEMGKF